MITSRGRWGWALAAALGCGCADEPAGSTAPIAAVPASERWALSSMDDQPLPVSHPQTQNVVREVTAGRLSTESDGTWTFRYDHHDTGPGVDREASSGLTGRYALRAGDPVVMVLTDGESGESYTGTIADAGLDVAMQGHRYRFTRAR